MYMYIYIYYIYIYIYIYIVPESRTPACAGRAHAVLHYLGGTTCRTLLV